VLKEGVLDDFKNIANELQTTKKLEKYALNLSRAKCKVAERVYVGRKCTKKCLKPKETFFDIHNNRCLLNKDLRKSAFKTIRGGHLGEGCPSGKYNALLKKCEPKQQTADCADGYEYNPRTEACDLVDGGIKIIEEC